MEEKEMCALWERAREIYLATSPDESERNKAERYFSMVTSLAKDGDTLTVSLGSAFSKSVFDNDMAEKLARSLHLAGAPENFKTDFRVVEQTPLRVPPPRPEASVTSISKASAESNATIGLSFKPEYTFSEFVKGPSNSWAFSSAVGAAKKPGHKDYNPLFIHGGTGLGKTHLMQAIGNELKVTRPDLKICYINTEAFLNEYMNALQKNTIDNFRERYRSLDVLLMDDVQFMAAKNNLQEEFFNTLYKLQNDGKQIVMTSDVAPKDLPALEPRLLSRFEGGLVQSIEAPQYETRLAILKKKAENFSTKIPDLAITFIAENIRSHVRAMEGALNKIKILVESDPNFNGTISNTVLAIILKDQIEKEKKIKATTCQDIINTVCQHFNISIEQILSSERPMDLVIPRQMAMFISYNFTGLGLKQLAAHFKKSHATVLNGVKQFRKHLDTEPSLGKKFDEVINKLGFSMKDMKD